MKPTISNVAAVGIIHRQADPSQLFLEQKDRGHPAKLVWDTLCPIGGNWIGPAAKEDRTPFDTFRREVREELTLRRPTRSTNELRLLGHADEGVEQDASFISQTADHDDEAALATIREVIERAAEPFGYFLNTVSSEAFLRADPEKDRPTLTTLVRYYSVPLDDDTWEELLRLQERYGNLSAESQTIATNFTEIVERKLRFAFAHDDAYRHFAARHNIQVGAAIGRIKGATSFFVSPQLEFETYEDILGHFEVQKRP